MFIKYTVCVYENRVHLTQYPIHILEVCLREVKLDY